MKITEQATLAELSLSSDEAQFLVAVLEESAKMLVKTSGPEADAIKQIIRTLLDKIRTAGPQ
jgi:hypothetical protein